MKKLLVILGLGMLVATTGCEIENRGHHRGGVYGGVYGEYPDREHGRGYYDRDHDRYERRPYDRDHYYQDRW
jgi:hypothetical protein